MHCYCNTQGVVDAAVPQSGLVALRPTGTAVRVFGDIAEQSNRSEKVVAAVSMRTFWINSNRAVGIFGLLVLPALIARHFFVCSWCSQSFILRRLPIFSSLLTNGTLLPNDLCLVEMACSVCLLFRVSYLGAAHKAIVDTHINRMRRLGRDPRESFIKGVLIGLLIFFVIGLEMMTSSMAFGPTNTGAFFMSGTFAFVFAIPEIILYIRLLSFGELAQK